MPRHNPALVAARAAGLLRYHSDKPCPRGHVGDRFVSSKGCVQCLLDRKQTPERKARNAARAARAEGAKENLSKGAKLIAVEAIDFSAPGWAHLRGGAGNLAKVAA